jgi:hypothetical protein
VTLFEKNADHRNAPTFNALRSYTIDITGHGAKAVEYLGHDVVERFDRSLIPFHGIRVVLSTA